MSSSLDSFHSDSPGPSDVLTRAYDHAPTDEPPFCPNKDCRFHLSAPSDGRRWWRPVGTYPTKAFGRVRRYRCRECGIGFSEQTFSLDYFIKKPLSYRQIFERVTAGSGLRSIARRLGADHQMIASRLTRLARQAIAVHAQLLHELTLSEDLVADGFESFVSSQYEPNNIHLLAGSSSQFLYSFDFADLKRKGGMTERQKSERERREEQLIRSRISVGESFSRIVKTMKELIFSAVDRKTILYSDEKQEYGWEVAGSLLLRELERLGYFSHIRISSKIARTVGNKLFPVNYLDRLLRKDNANHVRETVQFSQTVAGALERVAVYQMQHNYFKPYRIDDGPKSRLLHAEVAGIDRRKISRAFEGIFERRRFFSRVSLHSFEIMVWMRMIDNVGRKLGGFRPAYIWM